MLKPSSTSIFFAGFLFLSLLFLLSACSDDSSGPTSPPDDNSDPNTPDIPTVDNPQDELPGISEFLGVESAELKNFSPDLTGASANMLDILNEAHVLNFRLPQSRNRLVHDGKPCFPEKLEFSDGTGWYGLGQGTVITPYSLLGSLNESYYYLFENYTRWMFADSNCRNFGGHLASLTSSQENEFVQSAVQAHSGNISFFIGLTDWGFENNGWIWTSGEDYEWNNWRPGEPNNAGNEQFTEVTSGGQWNDTKTGNQYGYVMECDQLLPELSSEEEVACASFGSNFIFLDKLAGPSEMPYIQRRVYWQKVFQVTLGAGATYSEEHSYTHGTSETTGMSFGWSIGISVSSSWGFVSAEIESEFHQDFNHEVTVSSEETFTKTYTATAPESKTMLLALWQLRERFVIVDSEGNPWNDPNYQLNGDLPYLDQGLQQEYLQTILFDQ